MSINDKTACMGLAHSFFHSSPWGNLWLQQADFTATDATFSLPNISMFFLSKYQIKHEKNIYFCLAEVLHEAPFMENKN